MPAPAHSTRLASVAGVALAALLGACTAPRAAQRAPSATPSPTASPTPIASPACAPSFARQRVPDAGSNGVFEALAAVSSTRAWAVGSTAGSAKTLVHRWNGRAWSAVSSPSPGGTQNRLLDVDASGANDAWAVGTVMDRRSHPRLLATRWDGRRWSLVATPSPGGEGGELTGVATTGREVWAVGASYDFRRGDRTLALRWRNGSWQRVPSGGGFNRRFEDVDAGDGVAWAVGRRAARDGSARTLIARFTGSRWQAVTAPSPGVAAELRAVAVVDRDQVWAAGEYTDEAGVRRPLLLRFDGARWRRVVLARERDMSGGSLYAVAAGTRGTVIAVGTTPTATGADAALVLHGDAGGFAEAPASLTAVRAAAVLGRDAVVAGSTGDVRTRAAIARSRCLRA